MDSEISEKRKLIKDQIKKLTDFTALKTLALFNVFFFGALLAIFFLMLLCCFIGVALRPSKRHRKNKPAIEISPDRYKTKTKPETCNAHLLHSFSPELMTRGPGSGVRGHPALTHDSVIRPFVCGFRGERREFYVKPNISTLTCTGDFRFRHRSPNADNVEDPVLDFDLISSHHTLTQRRSPSPEEMGQKPSSLWSKPKISLTWALKGDLPIINTGKPSLEQKPNNLRKNHTQKHGEIKQSKPEVQQEVKKHEERRSVSPTSSTSTGRLGRRRRMRRARPRPPKTNSNFGYEIQDVDEFLTKASLDSPGNIPMVLSRPCVLYETHTGGPQREVSLPLGMVVNGVLKNRAWLYAQTPHGEEGYVPYACCLPLGILPAPSRPQPCWDTQTDIFPRPSGNRTDREKLKDETRSEYGSRSTTNRKRIRRDSGERSVDGLYLRASRKPPTRQTLLVIGADYKSPGSNKLSVCKGDVVSLISSHLKDWFWVRDRNGKEGFIPAVVAGHGFL